ncbi:hypothetical protein Pelo_3891 [Pelomyxa schiedti]|nr:hypothetical protein Pelo_3891 [Pelomyxa schiedti]
MQLVSEVSPSDIIPLRGGDAATFIGRSSLPNITDKRCSRKQVSINVLPNGKLSLKVLGVNPSSYTKPNGDFTVLAKGKEATLEIDDRLCLLCDGSYPFKITKAPEKTAYKSAPPLSSTSVTPANKQTGGNQGFQQTPSALSSCAAPPNHSTVQMPDTEKANWYWLSDDGWKIYSDEQSDIIESGFLADEKKVDIDSERFVDLVESVQRRIDDPSKQRKVKREVTAVPTSAQRSTSSVVVDKIFSGLAFHYPGEAPRALITSIESRGGSLFRDWKPSVSYVLVEPSSSYKHTALLRTASRGGSKIVSPAFIDKCIASNRVVEISPFIVALEAPKPVTSVTTSTTSTTAYGSAQIDEPIPRKRPPVDEQHDQQQAIDEIPREPPRKTLQIPKPTATTSKIVWSWRSDDPETWIPYDPKISTKIEAAYNTSGKDTIERVMVDKTRYIDLRNLKQKHTNAPLLERDVKRTAID